MQQRYKIYVYRPKGGQKKSIKLESSYNDDGVGVVEDIDNEML